MILLPVILIELMISNIFKVLLFLGFFIFDIFFLGIAAEHAAIAIGGALAGAMVLGYIRREKYWVERIIKTICSATAAIFLAPAIIKYYSIESREYVGLIFFLVSTLALFVLRAAINLTEQNAATAIKQVFIRVFNIQVKEKRERHIHTTKGE